ncbi:MAG: hypothetical protein QOF15_3070 [Mycobacterium sp.]|jgi:hypothetical protein|nr:hypothetical protein [Mycobacterium sp.]
MTAAFSHRASARVSTTTRRKRCTEGDARGQAVPPLRADSVPAGAQEGDR